jgi:hypothetical protein
MPSRNPRHSLILADEADLTVLSPGNSAVRGGEGHRRAEPPPQVEKKEAPGISRSGSKLPENMNIFVVHLSATDPLCGLSSFQALGMQNQIFINLVDY